MHIERGSGEDGIKCILRKAQFTDKSLSYEAVSYVWGSFEEEIYISVDGERFRITPNLAEVMKMLRRRDEEVIMWIDALCINQTDPLEKNKQIPRMGEIYSKAAKVIAFVPDKKISPEISESLMQWQYFESRNYHHIPILYDILNSLLESKYWERAWIVQEILLARDKYIQCGPYQIPFSKVQLLYETLSIDGFDRILPATNDSSKISEVLYNRDWHPRFDRFCSISSELSIIEFLDGFLESKCSDQRNHVYAFCNLLPEKFRKNIPIQYNEPKESVLRWAFQEIIKNMQSLYIITLRSRQISPSEPDTLPSWCPALGVPYMNHPNKEKSTYFCATEDSCAQFSQGGEILYVKGLVVGKVRHRLPRLFLADCPFKDMKFWDTRVRNEHRYMFNCIRFLVCYERVAFSESVLGEIFTRDELIKILTHCERRNRKSFNAKKISDINHFAKLFNGMQICTYKCQNIIACGRHNTESPCHKKKFHSAIIPQKSRQGDLLCAIHGCEQLVVLRHQQNESYTVVGEARIYGETGNSILCRIKGSELMSFSLK